MSRLKNIVKRSKSHKVLIENFSYLAFLQVFLLLYPLITYPYLVDVLGKEIYGIVLTAQMLASYASLFIDFGSNFVCAKHVSIKYLQLIIPQYFISNKSGIWSLSLIVHSKG